MAKKTVSVITCDGSDYGACGKVIAAPSDGVVVFGRIYAGGTGESSTPTVGAQPGSRTYSAENETALCWSCFHKRFAHDSVLAEALSSAVRGAEAARYHYHDEDPPSRAGNGPSGPLPPPELPRCVSVISALIAKS